MTAEEAPELWPFVCPHCEQASNAVVRGRAYWPSGNTNEGPPGEWTLVQCDHCDRPSVLLREDFGSPNHFADDTPMVVYPVPPRLSEDVPSGLRREWDEAQTCFRAKAYAASVVMVRRTLEGTTADQGATKGTLAKRLEEMANAGLIDATLAKWADALRIIGNTGAHYTGKPVTREDAEDALAFAEALLDHIYVLRKRFDEFRRRLKS